MANANPWACEGRVNPSTSKPRGGHEYYTLVLGHTPFSSLLKESKGTTREKKYHLNTTTSSRNTSPETSTQWTAKNLTSPYSRKKSSIGSRRRPSYPNYRNRNVRSSMLVRNSTTRRILQCSTTTAMRTNAVNLKVHTSTRSFANIPITRENMPFSLRITVLPTSDRWERKSEDMSNANTYTTSTP